ncbi:hypothetical protein AURDEDRAFT_59639 [Auricularia subglabra TFB-10046 SS5]|nr:hypothetical protein AURDEDRAFT_59639 [Auricularia subglabra TFB-10046 SS5]
MGYFPCAPKRPSLAFSIRLLEFISLHSLNVAPNITAWAATLEAFWARRGFVIQEKRAFRRRLGNAVHWYQVLVNSKEAAVRKALSGLSMAHTSCFSRIIARFTECARRPEAGTSSPGQRAGGTSDARAGSSQETQDEGSRARPSEYLRRRCHLCFGGHRPDLTLSR